MRVAVNHNLLILVAALSLVAFGLAGCGEDESDESARRTPPRRPLPANRRPQPGQPSSADNPSPGQRAELAELQRAIHQMINQHRQSLGLRPLALTPIITEQAEAHSRDMASGRAAFGHDGFKTRTERIAQRLPHKSSAENVATNRGVADPAREAVTGWLNSPGHRKNIEGRYNLTGIGVAKNEAGEYYFTQVFLNR